MKAPVQVKKDAVPRKSALKDPSKKRSATSESVTPASVEPQQKKPTLYCNVLIGGGNASSILCEKYNLDVIRHPVHVR